MKRLQDGQSVDYNTELSMADRRKREFVAQEFLDALIIPCYSPQYNERQVCLEIKSYKFQIDQYLIRFVSFFTLVRDFAYSQLTQSELRGHPLTTRPKLPVSRSTINLSTAS